MITPSIKAIPTDYNGYRFRSRLEARWAVFMETLGVRFEYEPEAYDLDGTNYLPDFWLPDLDCFLEIKGSTPTATEIEKAKQLVMMTSKNVVLQSGSIPLGWEGHPVGQSPAVVYYLDFRSKMAGRETYWKQCPECKKIELMGGGGCGCWDSKIYKGDISVIYNSPDLLAAYGRARGYRFEPGAQNP